MEHVPDQSEVFDLIAPGWYGFRHNSIFDAELTELARRWEHGRLLNLGCGHGADFVPFKDSFELFGVDFAAEMLKYGEKYAQKQGFEPKLTLADIRSVPFADDFFDCAISVACMHHLPDKTEQLKALVELKRVLKPGAEAFITVWNRNQFRFWFKHKELLLPWKTARGTVHRYYYLFTFGEITKLVRSAGLELLKVRPEQRYRFPVKIFSRNICVLVKKPL